MAGRRRPKPRRLHRRFKRQHPERPGEPRHLHDCRCASGAHGRWGLLHRGDADHARSGDAGEPDDDLRRPDQLHRVEWATSTVDGIFRGDSAVEPGRRAQIAFQFGGATYRRAADTGTMVALTATPGISGGTQPTWFAVLGHTTNDGGQKWRRRLDLLRLAVENWGIAPVPFASPSYTGVNPRVNPLGLVSCWIPNAVPTRAIIDQNGNIQGPTAPFASGSQLPLWSTVVGGVTIDGQTAWVNYGPVASWCASTNYGGATAGAGDRVILDSNGYLQGLTPPFGVPVMSGTTEPSWNTTLGKARPQTVQF